MFAEVEVSLDGIGQVRAAVNVNRAKYALIDDI